MKMDDGTWACAMDREIAPIHRKMLDMVKVVDTEKRKKMKK